MSSLQRLLTSKINRQFINKLLRKYNSNTISTATYLIERLKFNKINKGFVTEYESQTKLISPISDVVDKIDNFDLIFHKYEIDAFHCAKAYNDFTNNTGVLINTTESDFTDFTDVLCITKPLLSICIFNTKSDLKQALKQTTSIHPCFKDSKTINSAQKFPGILEYLLSLTKTEPTAPVHINISREMCDKKILLQELYRFAKQSDITDIQNLADKLFLEEIYKKVASFKCKPFKTLLDKRHPIYNPPYPPVKGNNSLFPSPPII